MVNTPIYMDYMATTPVDPQVVNKMVQYLGPDGAFGNPASNTHSFGLIAAHAVEKARDQIASALHANPEDIIFTSGATESNNLAIMGAAHFYKRQGKHLITMSTEHKSVLDAFQQLEKEGFEVTYLDPKPDGLLDIQQLKQAFKPDTILVSIMHVNNEIGVIQDIASIGALVHEQGALFHVDAAQSACKLPIDVSKLPVDLMSFSGHKNYGPKGIGALYVRHKPRVRLEPMSFGGGHESGLRSGTLATHQIVGMGEAFALGESTREVEQQRILSLRQKLWHGIKHLKGVSINGHEHERVAGNLNISFSGIDGDSLLLALRELAVSTKSACASASAQPSYVLSALGLDANLVHSAVRISLGRFTTEEQVMHAIEVFTYQIPRLHEMSTI